MRQTVKNNIAMIELVLGPGIQPADFTLDTRSWCELGEHTTTALEYIVGVPRARAEDPPSIQDTITWLIPKVLLQKRQCLETRRAFQVPEDHERNGRQCAKCD